MRLHLVTVGRQIDFCEALKARIAGFVVASRALLDEGREPILFWLVPRTRQNRIDRLAELDFSTQQQRIALPVAVPVGRLADELVEAAFADRCEHRELPIGGDGDEDRVVLVTRIERVIGADLEYGRAADERDEWLQLRRNPPTFPPLL